MKRRRFFCVPLLLAGIPARAQVDGRIPRIGFLDSSPAAERQRLLHDGMKALGYREGPDYRLEYRAADGDFERLPGLAAELVKLPVRVLIARNTPATSAARAATGSIPIVMVDVGDPLALGFVRSLSRPGANLTGLSNSTIELLRKRLDLLHDLVPALRRVAILSNSADANTPLQLAEVGQAAKALRLEARVFDARSLEALPGMLREAAAWKPQGALPLVHPLRPAMTPSIIRWSVQEKLPTIFAAHGDARAGGIVSYGADLSDQYRRVAVYVDRLLKGANAAELPVERPTRIVLSVNLRTARAIGLRMPRSLLAQADEVIE